MNQILTIPRSIQKFGALLAIFSLLATSLPIGALTAMAESTGVTINPTSVTTEVDAKINFVVSTTSNASTTLGTYIAVTDNGAGGNIFDGTTIGECNNPTPDADSKFSIDQNKGVCYSNSTPGVYPLSVQLYDSSNVAIGGPAVIEVTVTEPAVTTTGSITTEEFVTVDGSYKGISVGFRTEDFGTATSASVTIERADGSTVTKTANQGVLDIINQDTPGGNQLTAPFVIADGSFTEASDITYWNPAPTTVWNTNTRPVKATITVTDENGDVSVTNSTFNDGDPSWPTYESLLPPTLDSFPSTNDENRTNNHPHVNFVSNAPGSVTLEFVNPTNEPVYFEIRKDNTPSTGTNQWGPCRIGADPLSGSCDGQRYLTEDDYSYPSKMVGVSTSSVQTFENLSDNVSVRMTFGPERDWDFDWVSFQAPAPKNQDITNVVVHPFDLQGWTVEETGGGQTDFVKNEVDAPLGDGNLKLASDSQNTARASVSKEVDELLADVSGLAYSTKQNAANVPAGNAAYRIRFDADGNLGTTNDVATLIYEPYWQNNESPDQEPVVAGVWQDWDVDEGTFWVSVPSGSAAYFAPNGITNGAGGPPFFTIDEIVAFYPDARVTSFGVGIGSYNPSYDIDVDEIVFGVESETDIVRTIYDFEPAPTGTVTLCKLDQFDEELSGWQLALVGDGVGTYQVPSNGSVVTTSTFAPGDYIVKSTGTFKYRSPNYQSDARFTERATTDAGYDELEYKPWNASNIGGLHIDNDNTLWGNVFNPDHTYYAPLSLVSADSVDLKIGDDSYGDNVGNLTAAVNYGYTGITDENGCVTFNEVTYGTYQVEELLQTGWVNESGLGELVVDEEVVEHEIVNIDTTMPPAAPEHESPEDEAVQNFNDFYFDWTDVDGAVEYEFQSSQNPAVDGNNVLTTGVWNNKANGTGNQVFLASSTIHSVGATGTWYWQVRAIDAYGNKSEWTNPWKVTIDMVAPSVPVITTPTNEQVLSSTPILNQWDASTDNVAVAKYQIAYRYDDGHTFGGTTCSGETIDGDWVGCRDVNGTSRNHSPSTSEQGGVTIWVRAIDEAGNMSDWSDPVHYYYYTSGSLPVDEAPAVPTGLGWTDSNGDPVTSGGTTELVSGTATWAANSETDFNHYIYRYWNSIPDNQYNSTSTAYVVNNGTSNSRSGSFNQGEGTHYFCISAVDNAGNESECSDDFTIIYDVNSEEPEEPTATTTVLTVSGNTAVAENQPGWLFNRDTDTQSPYAFMLGTSTLGTGSLFINPITNSIHGNNDKFIAELFLLSPVSQLDSLSYDFNIAAVDAADENEFYMNVYANFGISSSTKYYDCKYDVVPTAGTVDGWTTVTFNPDNAYPVTTGGTSPAACPTSPSAMGASSTIRAVALNVGDTSANDQDVSGYFDNVKVVQTVGSHTETTIYDFEPTAPETTTGDTDTTPTFTSGSSSGGSVGGGSSNNEGPVKKVLGASTDSDTYDLLQSIKNRLAQMLVGQYFAPVGSTPTAPSGAVLGESTSIVQASTTNEVKLEEGTDSVVRNEKESENADKSTAPWWGQFLWIFVALWLLATVGGYWRKSLTQDARLLLGVQAGFGAVALLLLAAYLFFGLTAALWPSLIVIAGSAIAYYLNK